MFSRHELVWLTADGWQAARAQALPGQRAAVAQWQREDWPAIVRRSDAGVGADTICLGIAPPPSADGAKQRISLQLHGDRVARTAAPMLLREAREAAPARWQAALAALDAVASLRVYGSLAMQAITRLPYLSANSDIDLLFQPSSVSELDAGLRLLEAHAALLPLDGEIVFPSGAAVAWKEWIAAERGGARVLVKDSAAVRLAPLPSLLATLEAQ